jgi:hypothetical protein
MLTPALYQYVSIMKYFGKQVSKLYRNGRDFFNVLFIIAFHYVVICAQPYVSTDTPPSCYEIEARVRNGMTAYEGVILTPSTPPVTQPNNLKWQMNPSGMPVWNSNGNHYGDIHTFLFTYTPATGTAVWKIDFNRDGDYTDSKESITNVSPTLVGKGFQYISILGQGYEGKTAAVMYFTINGVDFGSYSSSTNTPFSILYEDSTGLFKDIRITGSFSFSGSATPERPRIWVRLGESNFAPTCVLTKPLDGTLYALGSTIHLEAIATDVPGKIIKVEFYDGNNKVGEDLVTPYSFDWNNSPPDFRTLRAIAIDNHSAMTWSNSVTIVVNAPPEVSVIIPLNGHIYYDPDTISILAQVIDPNDTTSEVEFFLDGGFIGKDDLAPYVNTSLLNQPMGNYSIRVKSTDPYGASSYSIPVDFTVQCIREDLNNDGLVNVPDFLLILSVFRTNCSFCRPDFNDDTAINTYDFLRLLAKLGYGCN